MLLVFAGGFATTAAAGVPPTGAVPEAPGCPVPARDVDERWSGQARWLDLEKAGYRIGNIHFDVLDVYVGERDELRWYQKLANTLHIESSRDAINDLLTIDKGNAVEARRIYEAERVLRRLGYLKDAAIHPIRCEDGKVDVVVRARDAWTLKFSLGIGTAGGESTSQIGLEDRNFLGTGKGVSFSRKRELTRTSTSYGYDDPALLGTDLTFSYKYRNLSDGKGNTYRLAKPFRRLDQEWSFAIDAEDTIQEVEFHNETDLAWSARQSIRSSRYEARRLVDHDGNAGWRVGLGWERDLAEFSEIMEITPGLRPRPNFKDRDLHAPYLSLERFHDDFSSYRNLRAMEQAEDYNLGFVGRLTLGSFDDKTDQRSGEFGSLEVSNGTEIGDDGLLLYRVETSGRRRNAAGGHRWEAAYTDIDITGYYPSSWRHTWVLNLELDSRERADPEEQLYLGGISGMYGYPQHFRVGDQRWILHAEHRYLTDTVLFDTLKIGYTVFVEAGRIRDLDGDWSRQFADVGVGFRIGNLRSAFADTYYIAIVAPMTRDAGVENYQFVAGNVIRF